MIRSCKEKVLSGGSLTSEEALRLSRIPDRETLYEAAGEITDRFHDRTFDLCSIINAKSGRCSEDCKWCAQSARHRTKVDEYPLVPAAVCETAARENEAEGIGRFSLVTSGRKLSRRELDAVCAIYRHLREKCRIGLCASLGLLDESEMNKLYAAGVTRYHCNLESAPSYFPELCTTHTTDEKIATLLAARRAGMSLCSGGIVGMGETMEQRIELAFRLRELAVDSIPLNLLQPIPGTPLERQPPLSEEALLTTFALFRFIHPTARLRFAGGRMQLSAEAQRKAIRIGMNAAISGNMLTTTGSTIAGDKALIQSAGYAF